MQDRLSLRLAASVRQHSVTRTLIVAGLVLASAGIGLLPEISSRLASPIVGLAMIGTGVAAIALLLWVRSGRFEYGIMAVPLAAGLLNFFTLPTGSQSRLVVSLLVACGLLGLWVLEWLVVHREIQLVPLPINRPLLCFVVISAISFVWSNLLRDPLVPAGGSFAVVQAAALVVNVALPLLTLLVANKIGEVCWLQRLTWIVIGLGVLAFTAVAFNLPTSRLIFNGSRGLFPMWVAALAYSQALFNEKLRPAARGFLLSLVGLGFYYYLYRQGAWLSGWVPMLVACSLITAMRSGRLLLVVGLLAAVYFALNFEAYFRGIFVANVDDGGLQRLGLWQRNIELVARHPLFGVGPAGYAVYYMAYNASDARSTHNNYFDVVAQTGILGLVAFGWLFVHLLAIGRQTFRMLRQERTFEAGFASATVAGCAGALLAMMLGDWVLPFAYNQTIAGFDNASFTWLLLGGMVSLHLVVKRGNRPPALARAVASATGAASP